ncbi:unnamed protein product [Polarella glacialis]|uniref:Uncharacterized protein n=1 Tax=Polarella glacialis TaxID=89957 RepID=A0A813HRX5_POLGL|nr:unnamed protein product [Polarella glacialis]
MPSTRRRHLVSVVCAATLVAAGATVLDMPCSSLACSVGYSHRWNAATTSCSGICDVSRDLQECCVIDGFSSHSWRLQAASSVGDTWDLVSLSFYMSANCSQDSVADVAPGFNHRWRGWPNGQAFSNHGGHGAVAANLFAPSPPLAVRWSSGAPCGQYVCFIGFRWESDVDRFPFGDCKAPNRGACSTAGQLQKAGTVRVACAEVVQSQTPGHFAEHLRLQLLYSDGRDGSGSPDESGGVWRTAAEIRNLVGGLAQLQLSG